MYDLTVYVPTKGRPNNALRLLNQFNRTSVMNSRIVFILSSNDDKLNDYAEIGAEMITVTPDKPGFVSPLNLGYQQDTAESYTVGFMGDDHFPRAVRWDERAVDELKKLGSGLVYGNDLLQKEAIPTHIFMTADIPAKLGFMTLPRLQHLYADNFWLDLGNALGNIKYLPDVVIEHLHPAAGKAIQDEGYDFSGSYLLDQNDKRLYLDYLDTDLIKDVEKLRSTGC